MADTVVEQKTEQTTDRKSAIAAAVASADAAQGKEQAEKPEEKKEEEKKVETTKVEDKEKEDQERAVTENARNLYQALNDPAKAPTVVKFLAEHFGYVKSPENKAEVKEIKDEIQEALLESLKDENSALDMSFLAGKLAPAMKKIEKLLLEKVEAKQQDIREEFQKQEAEKLKTQSTAACERLADSFFGEKEIPENVTKEMSTYMDRVPPTSDMSVKDYVEDAFHYAVGKLGLTKVNKQSQERSNKNRTDAASRLASERTPGADNLRTDSSKKPTRQDAIKAAIEAVEKDMK